MTTSRQKRIDEYSSKIIELQKKIKAEKAKAHESARKERTRRLIQLGGFIESVFSTDAIAILQSLNRQKISPVERWLLNQKQAVIAPPASNISPSPNPPNPSPATTPPAQH